MGDTLGSARPDGSAGAFRHEALLYEGDPGFLAGTVPFIREGIARDEPVLVVVDERKIGLLTDHLGDESATVCFTDMVAVGQNPARIIPAWREFVDHNAPGGRPFRGIGEPIWPGRTSDELVECQQHESLLNVAFAGSGSWALLCPYDTSALPPWVIDEAHRSHEVIVDQEARRPSATYRGVTQSSAPLGTPLPQPQRVASEVEFGHGPLHDLRELVAMHAKAFGLDDWRADDVVLAVNEVVTNTLQHGGGRGLLRVWNDGRAFICEVRDQGSIGDPLVGRQRPSADQDGGRGLWIANQLCHLVQIRTPPEGTTIRMHVYR